jgi:hypothetical protein
VVGNRGRLIETEKWVFPCVRATSWYEHDQRRYEDASPYGVVVLRGPPRAMTLIRGDDRRDPTIMVANVIPGLITCWTGHEPRNSIVIGPFCLIFSPSEADTHKLTRGPPPPRTGNRLLLVCHIARSPRDI